MHVARRVKRCGPGHVSQFGDRGIVVGKVAHAVDQHRSGLVRVVDSVADEPTVVISVDNLSGRLRAGGHGALYDRPELVRKAAAWERKLDVAVQLVRHAASLPDHV
ncbi:hypothetical protein OHA72_57645 [Dactylosporangium sp. NBC_01737]|uniref:hypothetical protein n=1 Tax=Dactylosporangium sp. NBC_01737 TaxID=2975959 RepID=UPI002E14ADF3|nr:hypothetical protein OHA72_57645 [Dactylosporangium sp. NBC_01737]